MKSTHCASDIRHRSSSQIFSIGFIQCSKKADPFLIQKDKIGLLERSYNLNQIDSVFVNDSIVKPTTINQFSGKKDDINCHKPPKEIKPEDWKSVMEIYNDPQDIDLFTGGLLEEPVTGSILGPTFHGILGEYIK